MTREDIIDAAGIFLTILIAFPPLFMLADWLRYGAG